MKFAIILCAVLLVAGAQASLIGNAVIGVQQKIDAGIAAALKQVQETVENGQKRAEKIGEDLKVRAEALAQEVYERIRNELTKTDERITNITNRATAIDIEECMIIAETLEPIALGAIANMSSCIVEKMELGSAYIESIVTVSDRTIGNLNELRREAKHCADHVDGMKAAAAAIVCANVAAGKATWATAKGLPSVTATVAKLSYLLGTLHITLPHCTTRRGFYTLIRESDRVIAEVRRCVDRKIVEHNTSTSTSTSTSPSPSTSTSTSPTPSTSTSPSPQPTPEVQQSGQNEV